MKYLFALLLVGCSSLPAAQDQLKVGSYEAELGACVQWADSGPMADGCMCDVAKRYGREKEMCK